MFLTSPDIMTLLIKTKSMKSALNFPPILLRICLIGAHLDLGIYKHTLKHQQLKVLWRNRPGTYQYVNEHSLMRTPLVEAESTDAKAPKSVNSWHASPSNDHWKHDPTIAHLSLHSSASTPKRKEKNVSFFVFKRKNENKIAQAVHLRRCAESRAATQIGWLVWVCKRYSRSLQHTASVNWKNDASFGATSTRTTTETGLY